MGVRNFLIEGVSGTGKTSVAEELQRRGFHVVHGDRELAYQGDPETGELMDEPAHSSEMNKVLWQQKHHIWDLEKVVSVINDRSTAASFFAAEAGVSFDLSIFSTGFLFLRLGMSAFCTSGLMSGSRGTQLTGAENRRKRRWLRACVRRKKKCRMAVLSSTPLRR